MEDLDDLLDSALDDFKKVEISKPSPKASGKESLSKQKSAVRDSDGSGPSVSDGSTGANLGQGLGLGLPALTPGKKKSSGNKIGSSSQTGATSSGTSKQSSWTRDKSAPQRPLSATLDMLQQQTRETMGNIDVADKDELMGEELVENLMKQFEDLGGSQDMQSIMDTMMRQLLSKEVLHEPMKEIGERYPEWLAANKSQLSQEDYSRYTRQHQFILQLCDVYEATPDDFPKIMELMQNMQNCGQPPSDIVKELAPGLDLDQDGLPMLPDFGAVGGSGQTNCSIM
ncbi:peroxin-19 [Marchantia polymorpha subsp. ruderalis]|uniref:Uncharacterized protein n=2 Tax=Marchantia polymorpha TaxID=3197 RepID=A0AAF6BTW8_MARPO|nr:hypothetical protein MARPO_0045s0092 [Marchantia polymorpha]BBN15451.1 hypothetical protein Mp_6g19710 [Marchantia polymorpha subsp. ruderalis]PTQ39436.1 hypothetical protein MARPO_0045s0092 [Marchantia polymorpha]PTQ39437.1 hypothetical protein MARPO_0045s0092 [Marchantia polymorpha]BBN15452.1 hypothetical protein Mp_6g19710 [Marchantia polymorpha subsp. ruderalis]|eukprot:PTQ39435.1 hypothetical protein MARPO_0045s0092 [Marchantia polymorpha]